MATAQQTTVEDSEKYRVFITNTVHRGKPPVRTWHDATTLTFKLQSGDTDWTYKVEPSHVPNAFYVVVYDETNTFVEFF